MSPSLGPSSIKGSGNWTSAHEARPFCRKEAQNSGSPLLSLARTPRARGIPGAALSLMEHSTATHSTARAADAPDERICYGKPLARTPEAPRRAFTFAAAAACLICCFVTSSVPIPMMAVWAKTIGLTTGNIAWTVVWYFAGCIAVLILFARLSNFLGRKPVVLLSLVLGASASWIFSWALDAETLYAARFLQGLSCGFASSASMSWLVDNAPPDKPSLGTSLTAAGPNVGLSVGTLITGLLLEFHVVSPAVLFDATIALLALCAVMAILGRETLRFGSESLVSVLMPKVALPKRLSRIFLISAIGFVGTWGLGSFFQGFSARVSQTVFGESSALLAAFTYLLLIVPNAAAGLTLGRLHPMRTLPGIITGFLIAGLAVFGAMHYELHWVFMGALVAMGILNGATCALGFKLLLLDATLLERAGVISALYLTAYVGSGLPNLVVGAIAKDASMDAISWGYIAWMAATWVAVTALIAALKKHPSPAEALRLR